MEDYKEFGLNLLVLLIGGILGILFDRRKRNLASADQSFVTYGQPIGLRTQSGLYLKADLQQPNSEQPVIVAHSKRIQDWEKFEMLPVNSIYGHHPGRVIYLWDWIVLRAVNERFVRFEENHPHELHASADNAGVSCRFRIVPVDAKASSSRGIKLLRRRLKYGVTVGLLGQHANIVNVHQEIKRPARASASVVRGDEYLIIVKPD